MCVIGFQTIGVTYYNIISISLCFVFHDAHFAVECSVNGVASIYFDVKSAVHASPTRTVIGCDDAAGCGHMETSEVYGDCFWQ